VKAFTVGDVGEGIEAAVSEAARIADLVLVTGGLGPTPDDLTKAAVARTFGVDLIPNAALLRTLEERYRSRGLEEVPEGARGQADLPDGAVPLSNPEGTAPGILLRTSDALIVLLPGVPRELKAIVTGALRPYLTEIRPEDIEPTWHLMVHTTGIAESQLSPRLEACLTRLEKDVLRAVDVAYLPDLLGVDLRLSARGPSLDAAMARIEPVLGAIEEVVAPYRFESPSGDLAEAVAMELKSAGLTIAVAESCSGGLIAKRITDVVGASEVFPGGIVAYSNQAKVELVGVHAEAIATDGAVSETVARQLAEGVTDRFGTDVGIGITGIAGPGGGSVEKPVGTVWIATCVHGEVRSFRGRYAGGRDAVRARASQAALAAVYRRLVDRREGMNP
ncbi:MAG: CinA family nicotinamide mononucleotide deamidase-related protein, partial [Longimicrobiales bacterium]